MKNRALLLRAVGVFFCAFFRSVLIHVFPQLLCQRYFPAQKKLYLSIFLVTGTLSAIVLLMVSSVLNGFLFLWLLKPSPVQ